MWLHLTSTGTLNSTKRTETPKPHVLHHHFQNWQPFLYSHNLLCNLTRRCLVTAGHLLPASLFKGCSGTLILTVKYLLLLLLSNPNSFRVSIQLIDLVQAFMWMEIVPLSSSIYCSNVIQPSLGLLLTQLQKTGYLIFEIERVISCLCVILVALFPTCLFKIILWKGRWWEAHSDIWVGPWLCLRQHQALPCHPAQTLNDTPAEVQVQAEGKDTASFKNRKTWNAQEHKAKPACWAWTAASWPWRVSAQPCTAHPMLRVSTERWSTCTWQHTECHREAFRCHPSACGPHLTLPHPHKGTLSQAIAVDELFSFSLGREDHGWSEIKPPSTPAHLPAMLVNKIIYASFLRKVKHMLANS